MTIRPLFALALVAAAGLAGAAEIPLDQRQSGYETMGRETRAMQDDDTANPGSLWLLDGEALWGRKTGAANKACSDCHRDAATSMRGVAARYPDLPRDSALGKIGRQNLSDYLAEDPAGYAAMTARKVGRMWSSGVGEAMSSGVGRAIQISLVALGLAGFVLLGRRRRWWDLLALATPILLVTAIGAASLAAPRRNEVLMTLVFPLAALTLSAAASALSSSGRWSPEQASSPPN